MSQAAPRDATAFEVREALGEPGCAICHLALRSTTRLIGSIAYEQINDVDLRQVLRRARGFCNPHAHRWLREARNVLGTALIYRDVLRAALEDLDSSSNGRRGLLGGLLGAPESGSSQRRGACPICAAQREAEVRYLSALLSVAATEADVLVGSDGLCRRHALMAVRRGGPAAPLIAAQAREQIEALVRDLDEVIRKEDYRFRDEPRTESERTAPARAIAWAAGLDGILDR